MGTTNKHRLSTAEGFALIASYYEQGGQGAKQFYTTRGLTENQFYGWRKRYNRVHSAESTKRATEPALRPLQITTPALPATLEIEYANGNRLRLPCGESFSLELITGLLQVTTRV